MRTDDTWRLRICPDCQKPIGSHEPSYATRDPFGKTDVVIVRHSGCGDPLGTKAKDKRIAELEDRVLMFSDALRNIAVGDDAIPMTIEDARLRARVVLTNAGMDWKRTSKH